MPVMMLPRLLWIILTTRGQPCVSEKYLGMAAQSTCVLSHSRLAAISGASKRTAALLSPATANGVDILTVKQHFCANRH